MTDSEGYKFLDRQLVRTPFYSVEDYGLERMPAVLDREDFRNALWLASAGFYRLLEAKGFDFKLLDARERLTLYKYYNRMSFRATPFGAFAAFSLAGWSIVGKLSLVPGPASLLHLLPTITYRPDVHSGDNDLLALNPTLYRLGNTWRYIRSEDGGTGKLLFSLRELAAGRINNHLLGIPRKAPVPRSVILSALCDRAACNISEAGDYIDFLVDEQVLFTSEMPGLIQRTATDKGEEKVFLLGDLGLLSKIPGPAAMADGGASFYAALERPVNSGGMAEVVQSQLKAALHLLQRIVPVYPNALLQDYITAFKAKFESQKVPLLKAIDPDTGISYGRLDHESGIEGILDGLRFPVKGRGKGELEWTEAQRLLLKIWQGNNNRNNFDPVVIQDKDVEALSSSVPELALPPSLAVLYNQTANMLVLENIGGASGTALAGRFSVFSAEVHKLCRELAIAEAAANPDVIFAEIHQRSHDHIDNISRRRLIYDHVIPLNVFPGNTGGLQLLPADLLLSVQGQELVLESVSLGKRVVPRLPVAYNYHHTDLALFRLLCDMQFQGLRADLSLNPERLFPGLGYYPRIEYRDIILSLARWHLRKEEVSALCKKPYSLGRLHLFRQEHGIPPKISLGLTDQQLVFDLGKDEEAFFFLACLKDGETAVVREYLAAANLVSGEGKIHAAQGMALLKRDGVVYKATTTVTLPKHSLPERKFLPGSEWLYIKLYCTPQSADRLLLEVVSPVLKKHTAAMSGWFFIRYQDPENHLRIRIKMKDYDAAGLLLSAIQRKFAGSEYRELVREYRQDTYTRELERYSPELIEFVEDFFCAGSRYVLDLRLSGDMETLPIVHVWDLCRTFVKELPELVLFLKEMQALFLREFRIDEKLRADLDLKFRGISRGLKAVLEDGPVAVNLPDSSMMMERLRRLANATLEWPVAKRKSLLADLVHMQLNRLFLSRQREHEGTIYAILYKYSLSLAARKKSQFNGRGHGD